MTNPIDRLNIQRFTRRLPEVHGVQLTSENARDIVEVFGPASFFHSTEPDPNNPTGFVVAETGLTLMTQAGALNVMFGDWILFDNIATPVLAGVISDEILDRDFIHVVTAIDPDQLTLDIDI